MAFITITYLLIYNLQFTIYNLQFITHSYTSYIIQVLPVQNLEFTFQYIITIYNQIHIHIQFTIYNMFQQIRDFGSAMTDSVYTKVKG